MPIGRMGPPLRSFAADAHDCIMVQVLRPTGYKVVARFEPRPKAGSPSDRHSDRTQHLNLLTKKAPYKGLWGASSAAYFRVDELLRQLANPNLHDIPRNLPFRVEMWDQSEQHGVGQRCGRACCAGCGDCELSRSAVHTEEWDTRD